MQHIEHSVLIQSTPEAVYDYLKQPDRFTEWMMSLSEVRNVQGEGVGQTYEWTYRMVGIPLSGKTTVLEDERPHHIKTQSEGGVTSTWNFTLAAEGDGTRLKLELDYTVPIPVLGKLAEKLVIRRNDRETRGNLDNIKQILEA